MLSNPCAKRAILIGMRKGVLMAAVLLLAYGLAAQEKPAAKPVDVGGTWDLAVESPNGTGSRVLKLRQDGEKLTGEIESSMSSGKVAGSVNGSAVAFTATVTMESGTFEIRYTGKVDADKMTGDVDFGEYGRGTWSGTRRQ
jgi:L-seryl-tRNA(Ser) seleniumtransferase